jgi:hypothetical protein
MVPHASFTGLSAPYARCIHVPPIARDTTSMKRNRPISRQGLRFQTEFFEFFFYPAGRALTCPSAPTRPAAHGDARLRHSIGDAQKHYYLLVKLT